MSEHKTQTDRDKRYSLIWVMSAPVIDDPRELQTIITFSLRSLWGDLESHSCDLIVEVAPIGDRGTSTNGGASLVVRCRSDSVDAVRASLTLVTPPPYLEGTVYQFDVTDVQEDSRRGSKKN